MPNRRKDNAVRTAGSQWLGRRLYSILSLLTKGSRHIKIKSWSRPLYASTPLRTWRSQMELCLGPSMPLREGQGSDTWPREDRVDIAQQATVRRPAVQRAGGVLPCPPGPAQSTEAERTTRGQSDCI